MILWTFGVDEKLIERSFEHALEHFVSSREIQ